MSTLPSVFISHGAPTLAIDPGPAHEFLRGYGDDLVRRFGKPKAILVASAHWETQRPTLGAAAKQETTHDFGGFPEELHRMQYPVPGSAELVADASARLAAAGFAVETDARRGLDHGAWVPLRLMFPAADIPATQISIQSHLGPEHHWRIGEALAPLRDEGYLVVGSGQITHNLSEFRRYREGAAPPPHVVQFVEWFGEHVLANDRESLVDYRRRAPEAARNHPTDEHLLPIFVALGSSARGLRRMHESTTYGFLRMDVFESA